MSVDRRLLQRALDTLDDVIYVYDERNRLVYWNQRLNDLYGLSDAELDGMAAAEFFGSPDQSAVEAAIEEIYETGETVVEAWSQTTEGPVRFELTGRLLTDDGEVAGFAGIGRDVTERYEQAGRLSEQNDRLAEAADLLAHDLRNPLSVASGHLELARDRGRTESLDSVAAAHERIERIIADVRLATREGGLSTDIRPTDIAAVAREAWEYVDTADAVFEAPATFRLDADPDRLLGLFENLFRNAVEHGSTGNQNAERSDDSVEHGSTSNRTQSDDAVEHGGSSDDTPVTVRLETTADGFAVEDDGPGIDPDVRDRIFDPGVSGTASGTGFGLYIVHTIAAAHGWDVTVTEGDGGARFEFA